MITRQKTKNHGKRKLNFFIMRCIECEFLHWSSRLLHSLPSTPSRARWELSRKKHEISAQTKQLCNHATNEFPIRTRSGLQLRWPRLLAHMIAVLCNFHKFLCVQNKQQKRWEKMALGLLVSNFYKFAQFFSTFLCFFPPLVLR